MVEFGQFVIGGLGFGAIYALAALGLVLIFKTTGVVNFASGAMATVVTFVLWTALNAAGLPLIAAWLCAMAAALVIGALTEALFMRRVEGMPVLIQIVVTLGLLLLIEGLAGVIWHYDLKSVPKVANGAPLYVVFERTRLGLAMRAVAQDREVALLMGIPVFRLVTASWAVGVLVAGLAAILVAPTVSLSPTLMDDIAVFAFAAAVLGGFGSLAGAIVGGFIIGVVNSLIGAYLSTNYQLSLVFLLIFVVLYVRPQGLFGVEATTRQ